MKIRRAQEVDLTNLLELYHNKDFRKLKNLAEVALKSNSKSATLWNYLAVSEKNLGNHETAKEIYLKLLEENPNNYLFLSNLGHIYFGEGKILEASELYEKLVEIHPNEPEAHVALGRVKVEQLKLEEALGCFSKSLTLKSENQEATFLLADCYRKLERYAEAINAFEGLDVGLSRSHQLECLYLSKRFAEFNKKVIGIQRDRVCNPLVGAVLAHASITLGKPIANPFCNRPLGHIYKAKLPSSLLNKELITSIINYHRTNKVNYKKQSLLTKGTQSSGNLLLTNQQFVEPLRDILEACIKSYRTAFEHTDEGFLKLWPQDYNIHAWLVSITRQGSLAPHIHKLGWLSGSIYLQLPRSRIGDEGAISFGLHGANYPSADKSFDRHSVSIDVGDVCMFPSSLFHNTEPFDGNEERISLAFDMMPRKNTSF